jgi:hypothetical protein
MNFCVPIKIYLKKYTGGRLDFVPMSYLVNHWTIPFGFELWQWGGNDCFCIICQQYHT